MAANISIYLDDRRLRADGSAAVKICVRYGQDARFVATGITCLPEHWNQKKRRIKPDAPCGKALNTAIDQAESLATLAAIQAKLANTRASAQEVARAVAVALGKTPPEEKESKPKVPKDMVRPVWEEYQAMKTGRTVDNFATAWRRLASFCDADRLKFSDITRAWLMRFEAHLLQTANHNTIAGYLICLRAVTNYAIDEGITDNYPWRRFKIKRTRTPKRSLDIDEIRTLAAYEVEPWQEVHRDMFMLSFYLRGLNFIDLINLPSDAVRHGRIDINRSKTGELLSIKVEPEAQAIIDKYRGRDYLLNIRDRYANHRDFQHRCNDALKKIGPWRRLPGRGGKIEYDPLFPDLSSYWARHTWATLAAELDIPEDTIARGLGHADGSTTGIYINFRARKVDEANRKVIDWVQNKD